MKQQFAQFVSSHWLAIAGFATAIYTAAVTAWPEDKAEFTWYTYLRTVAVSLMPVAQRKAAAMSAPSKGVPVS